MEKLEEAAKIADEPLDPARTRLQEAVAVTRASGMDIPSADRNFYSRLRDTGLAGGLVIGSLHAGPLVEYAPGLVPAGFILAGGGAIRAAFLSGRLNKSPVETPLHSKVGVLRAKAPYGAIQPDDTILGIHPGELDGEQLPERLASAKRQQLVELRGVLDGTDYDYAIIPTSLTDYSGGRSRPAAASRAEVLETITGSTLYRRDEEPVAVWSKAAFEAFSRHIEAASDGTALKAVMTELTKIIPNPYAQAYLENSASLQATRPYLNRYLKQVLLRGLEGELLSSRRAPMGSEGAIKQSLTNRLAETHGELVVHQYDEANNLVSTEQVNGLASIKEAIGEEMFWQKLRSGHYSPAQLANLAIGLLSVSSDLSEEQGETKDPEVCNFQAPSLTKAKELVNPEVIRTERRQTLRRRLGMVMLALAIAQGGQLIADVLPEPPGGESTAPAAPYYNAEARGIGQAESAEAVEWRTEDKGINPAGYYQVRTYDKFNGKDGWSTSRKLEFVAEFPNLGLSDEIPHLLLKRLALGTDLRKGIWLPTLHGTYPSTIQIITLKDGPQVEASQVYGDGTGYMVKLPDSAKKGLYWLEVSFTRDKNFLPPDMTKNKQAVGAANMESEWEYLHQLASDSKQSFHYDNTVALKGITKQVKDAHSLVYAVEKAGICNCNLCASRVALIAQGQGIQAEYVAGYNNTSSGPTSSSYSFSDELDTTERHGWVSSPAGEFDPTPLRLSGAEVKAREEQTLKDMRVNYETEPETDGRIMALSLLPLLAYAGVEIGSRTGRRIRKTRQHRRLTKAATGQSYDYLNWVLFANHETPAPHPANTAPKTAEQMLESLRNDLPAADLNRYLEHPVPYDRAAGLNYRQVFAARQLARKLVKGKV